MDKQYDFFRQDLKMALAAIGLYALCILGIWLWLIG